METTEIPPEYRDRIQIKPGRDLQETDVLRVFLDSERPFLSRRQVQSRLDGDYTRGTVLNRLSSLCEVDILKKSEMNSSIYWLNNDKSIWPIPPDVEVESKNEETTIPEFLDQPFVPYLTVGIGLIVFASLVIWIGGYLQAISTGLLILSPTEVIAIGLLAVLIGWGLIIMGAVSWGNDVYGFLE